MKMVSVLTSPCQTDIKGVSAKGGVASRRLLVSLDSPQRHSGSAEKRQDPVRLFETKVRLHDLHGQTSSEDKRSPIWAARASSILELNA